MFKETINIDYDNKTINTVVNLFIRHFNREIYEVPSKFYPEGYSKYYNKEENEYRMFPCTEVSLYVPDIDTEITGTAICHKKDQFSKAFGRKLAMTRMLENLVIFKITIDKENREKLWKIILNRPRPVLI